MLPVCIICILINCIHFYYHASIVIYSIKYIPPHRLLVTYIVVMYCGAVSRNFDVGTEKLTILYTIMLLLY